MSRGAWVDFSKVEREPDVEIPPDVRRRMDARNRLPEPARCAHLFYRVPVRNNNVNSWWMTPEFEISSIDCVEFRKVRMRSEGGAIYLAWQCLEDETLYI